MASLMNGLSELGRGVAGFAATAGLEQQRVDAATALQQSGGAIAATAAQKLAGTQSDLVNQKAGLEADQARLADTLARATGSAGRQEAGQIAATAATAEQGFRARLQGSQQDFAAREGALSRANELTRLQMGIDAPSPEIKSAKQFQALSPAEKQAFREEAMTKAGLPAWMVESGNASPPTGIGAASDTPAITPDAGTTSPATPGVTGAPATPDSGASRNDKALIGLPGSAASIVKAMVDGRMAPPTSMALGKPSWQALLSKAAEYDPTFDQTSWSSRVATRKDFTSGKSAQNVTALNTALGHAGVVDDAMTALRNGGWPWGNAAMNWMQAGTGDARQGNTQIAVDALASEARKVFSGTGGGNLTELLEWQKNFPLNGSPAQQKGALNQFVNLLDSRLESLSDQYNRGMGRTDDPMNLLQPHARAAYEKLTGRGPSDATGYQMGTPPAGVTSRAASASSPIAAIPSWVKPGDQYSPSRGQARGADGAIYGSP